MLIHIGKIDCVEKMLREVIFQTKQQQQISVSVNQPVLKPKS